MNSNEQDERIVSDLKNAEIIRLHKENFYEGIKKMFELKAQKIKEKENKNKENENENENEEDESKKENYRLKNKEEYLILVNEIEIASKKIKQSKTRKEQYIISNYEVAILFSILFSILNFYFLFL